MVFSDPYWKWAGHRTRVIGTNSGRGPAIWQAWCEEANCTWHGPTWPHRHGSLRLAEADAEQHRALTAWESDG
jgi:hypothetical protein